MCRIQDMPCVSSWPKPIDSHKIWNAKLIWIPHQLWYLFRHYELIMHGPPWFGLSCFWQEVICWWYPWTNVSLNNYAFLITGFPAHGRQFRMLDIANNEGLHQLPLQKTLEEISFAFHTCSSLFLIFSNFNGFLGNLLTYILTDHQSLCFFFIFLIIICYWIKLRN